MATLLDTNPSTPALALTLPRGLENLWADMNGTQVRLRAAYLGLDLDAPDQRDEALAWLEAGAPVGDRAGYLAWLESRETTGEHASLVNVQAR
jgi:hypothetical protein